MQSYFNILGLPESFTLDDKALEQAYFAAQRATHPDRVIHKSEDARIAAFHLSQLVNEAYEQLKNPLHRAEHILALHGVVVNGEESNDVPPALLMEMMELRERLEEAATQGVVLSAVIADIVTQAREGHKILAAAFEAKDYPAAAAETTRMAYLGRAMEEAHMLVYRLKAQVHQ